MIDLIHHYCSPSVFLSLIDKKELWLTSLALSNDSAEGTWMLDHWLDKFNQSTPKERCRKNGAKLFVEGVLRNNITLGTCFSEKRDLLSQWRGYGQDGAGFSVSFYREKLEQLSRDYVDGSSLQLSKITYGGAYCEEVNAMVRELHEAFGEDASAYQEGADRKGRANVRNSIEKHTKKKEAACKLFTIKNGAFSEEEEWRLFLFDAPDNIKNVEFRESQNLLSPFVRLGFPPEAVAGVTLGPMNPSSVSMIELALKAHGIKCQVNRSSASYLTR